MPNVEALGIIFSHRKLARGADQERIKVVIVVDQVHPQGLLKRPAVAVQNGEIFAAISQCQSSNLITPGNLHAWEGGLVMRDLGVLPNWSAFNLCKK